MKKAILGGMILLIMSLVSLAGDELALAPDHPQTYVVKKGDTLWDISGIFLRDPWMWPEIWHVNPQVDNPHLIYPGDELTLVYIDGRPKLVAKRNGEVKLTPRMRISTLDLSIPAISLDVIGPFLSDSRVVNRETLDNAQYVLAGKSGHIVAGAGDELFARGDFSDDSSRSYGVFRIGNTFTDPDSGEMLGYQALSVGHAKVRDVEHDIATLTLNETSQEVRRGDRLLPDEERPISSRFFPSPAPEDVKGYIIAVEGGVSQIGAMDVVVINQGTREGVETGSVMAIYRAGEVVRDQVADELVKVPDSRAGLLMVFRAFDKVSYALVLKATQPIKVMDKIKEP